jgi:hypothetical protein
MNLDIILRKLYRERKKLDEIIASLEQLRRSAAAAEKKSGKNVRKNAGRARKKKAK